MKAAALLLLAGCYSPIRTVPTTNDPHAWRQRWVAESKAEHEAFERYEREQACDPLDWPNTAPLPEQHPECR